MRFLPGLLFAFGCAAPVAAVADDVPAKGKFLVATEQVRGSDFQESVILLLHHDDSGTAGLIVNKPTDIQPGDALPDISELAGYSGTLYYGGPVEMYTIRALVRSGDPPNPSERVIGDVHMVPVDQQLIDGPTDASKLRFYVGYAGWAPGQLDYELTRGSWHVQDGAEHLIFEEDSASIWRRLAAPEVIRASILPGRAVAAGTR